VHRDEFNYLIDHIALSFERAIRARVTMWFVKRAILPLLLLPLLTGATVSVTGPEKERAWLIERMPVLIREVEGRLGTESERSILVQLARNDREFEDLAGVRPEWVAAVAMPASSTLVVRLSAMHPERGTGLSPILRHELVHLLLPDRLRGAGVPQWFEVWLAQVVGGRLDRTDLDRVHAAAAMGRLIPFAEISERFPQDGDRATLAYAQGESMTAFLINEYGLTRLLTAVEKRGSLDEAITLELYGNMDRITERWKESLKERPLWLVIVSGAFLPLLFFAASLLAVAAIIRSRLKGRKVYESLPD
jgi:hypothetical protein